ncbi:MAG: hypothetical protein HQM16_06380 [Deltaproteobacteria bacterium]|nr:hypothetical protein [Deltaproteobacteria bacterium]
MLTTIQISKAEDRFITRLKKLLGLSSKKAVVMAGVQNLWLEHLKQTKAQRLQKAALSVQKESAEVHHEFSSKAFGLTHWDED